MNHPRLTTGEKALIRQCALSYNPELVFLRGYLALPGQNINGHRHWYVWAASVRYRRWFGDRLWREALTRMPGGEPG